MANKCRSSGVASAVALALLSILALPAAGSQKDRQLDIYLTDLGINQWDPGMTWFQDFSTNVKQHVVPDVKPEGQILIPMPADEDLPKTPQERAQWVQALAGQLAQHIAENADVTGGRYEIQMVQNINTLGYFDFLDRQAKCDRFASDVYEALAIAKNRLRADFSPTVRAIVGSNGGHVFAENVPKLADNPFDQAVLISPRAFFWHVIGTYKAMNGNLSIINEGGDAPSLPSELPWMVANHDHAKEAKLMCPGLGLYFVGTGFICPIKGHLKTADPDRKVEFAKEFDGKGYRRLDARTGWEVISEALGRQKAASGGNEDADLGGVDLSDLRLSYVSINAREASRPISPLFSSVYLGGKADVTKLKQAASVATDAFLVALKVSPRKFWVNLNPAEPDRIADPDLSRTDVTRVLLEADLQMKRDTAKITDPRASEVGREYWRRVSDAAGGSSGSLHVTQQLRSWIVPGCIELAGDEDHLYLIRADLDVRLESEYYSAKGLKAGQYDRASIESERVAKELVLPYLTDAVNHGSQYADLRRVYQGLIMATWYRQHHAGGWTPGGARIDSGDLSGLQSSVAWSPRAIWQEYVDSASNGEYNFTETRRESRGNAITTYITQYFMGGVDFTNIQLPDAQPLTPDMKALVAKAIATPEGVQRGQIVWFCDVGAFCSRGVPAMSDRSVGESVPTSPRATPVRTWRSLSGLTPGLTVAGAVLVLGVIWVWRRSREMQW
jgi:hypothetical protein